MTRFGRPRTTPTFAIQFGLLCCVAAVAVSGCATPRYHATSLPPEMIVPPVRNVKTVEWQNITAPADAYDVIGPRDKLNVTIVAGLDPDDKSDIPVRVDEDGKAYIPLIGELPFAGYTLEEAETMVTNACLHRDLYVNPKVIVEFDSRAVNQITILGAVNEPGKKYLPRGSSDLVEAIMQSEGLTPDAGTNIEIRRAAGYRKPGISSPRIAASGNNGITTAGHTALPAEHAKIHPAGGFNSAPIIQVNLVTASQSGPQAGYVLHDGDVVMVEKIDQEPITVQGLVRKPGQYPLPVGKEVRLLAALNMAEGPSSNVANKVIVIRTMPGEKDPRIIHTSIRQAKRNLDANLRLGPGDIVSIEQTPATVLMDGLRLIQFGIGASLGTFF